MVKGCVFFGGLILIHSNNLRPSHPNAQLRPAMSPGSECNRVTRETHGKKSASTAYGVDSRRIIVKRCQWCFFAASALSRSRNDKIMPRRGKPPPGEAWSINLHETEGLLTLVVDRLWVNGE